MRHGECQLQVGVREPAADAYQSINQSKFIFQVITEKLQCNNVVALKRLPEKH